MFISEALAQTAETAAGAAHTAPWANGLLSILLMVGVFYFILIRPERKRLKQRELELKAIIKGVKVCISGIIGTVTAVTDTEVKVEIAKDVEITVLRDYISQVMIQKGKDK